MRTIFSNFGNFLNSRKKMWWFKCADVEAKNRKKNYIVVILSRENRCRSANTGTKNISEAEALQFRLKKDLDKLDKPVLDKLVKKIR